MIGKLYQNKKYSRNFQYIEYGIKNLLVEDTALLFVFLSESVKVRFLPRVDTFSSDMLFIVSKQYMLYHPGYWHKNRFGLAQVSE
jgi:hypothetical protein